MELMSRKGAWRVSALVATAAAISLVVSGCSTGGTDREVHGGTIIFGTTTAALTLDPGAAYDTGSILIIDNVFQGLLALPKGSSVPQPDLADCEFTTEVVYKCVLRAGNEFSNGNPVTSKDVVFSFERTLAIAEPTGPAHLLSNMKSVKATDDMTVEFTLVAANQSWPNVLSAPVGKIVDSSVFPADAKLPDEEVIGSGPYVVSSVKPNQQVALKLNPNYKGTDLSGSSTIIVQYFQQPSALKLAVQQGDVDIAFRQLGAVDINDLRKQTDKVNVVEGPGTDHRFLAFNLEKEPGNSLAVRKAVASIIDRDAINERVLSNLWTPLYSMVGWTFDGYVPAYKDQYGTGGDVAAAKAYLEEAGITETVPMTIWFTPTKYGSEYGDIFMEIKRQLEESGLFTVTLESSEWQEYVKAAQDDQYAVFGFGGSADYPAALAKVSSFYVNGGYVNIHWKNDRVQELSTMVFAEMDDVKRNEMLAEIQQLAAADAPLIPLFQGKQVAVTGLNILGMEGTLDESGVIRFWELSKK